jgi:hypothetical protein
MTGVTLKSGKLKLQGFFLTEGVNNYDLVPLISELWTQNVRDYPTSRIETLVDILLTLNWAYQESPYPSLKLNESNEFK